MRQKLGSSERRACRTIGVARPTQRYEATPVDDDSLRLALVRLAKQYGRYGYRKIAELLRIEGWKVNHKKVERLWREEGLQIPQCHKKRKRLYHKDSSVIRLRPRYQNHIWSIDFVHDKLASGRPYKMLTVLDEYTREALCVAVKSRMGLPQPVGISGRSFHLISAVDIAAKAGPTSRLIKNYLELDSLIQVFGPQKKSQELLGVGLGPVDRDRARLV